MPKKGVLNLRNSKNLKSASLNWVRYQISYKSEHFKILVHSGSLWVIFYYGSLWVILANSANSL